MLDRVTNQPIQGAKLVFQHWKSSPASPYLWDTVGVTDANGYFKYYFHKKTGYEYNMWFLHKDYFYDNFGSLKFRKTSEDITLDPHSFLRMHIKKTSASSNYIVWATEACNGNFSYNNSAVDTIIAIPCPVRGGLVTRLSWRVYDINSIFQGEYHIDTLLNRGQTMTLNVQFY